MINKYKINVLDSNSDFKEWDEFVDISPQGCVFSKSWWLMSVCLKGFSIITVKDNNKKIIAGMPVQNEYNDKKEKIHNMPLFTQMTGILLFKNDNSKYCRYLSETMKIINLIIDFLSNYSRFYMQFHYNFTNWLPFYWKGYSQTTRYTYIIKDLTNVERIFSNFTYAKRCDIRKSKEIVDVMEDVSSEDFYNYHVNSLKKDNKKIRYSYEKFEKVYNNAYSNNLGKSWFAVDKNDNVYSMIFVVFDNKVAHYLISSIDPDFKKIGSISLLIWEAIKYSAGKVKEWNFEGSVRKNIEQSYRQFGGIQVPYFLITK